MAKLNLLKVCYQVNLSKIDIKLNDDKFLFHRNELIIYCFSCQDLYYIILYIFERSIFYLII